MRKAALLALMVMFTSLPVYAGSTKDPEFAYSSGHVTVSDSSSITLTASNTIYTDPIDVSWGDTCSLGYRAWSAAGAVDYDIDLEVREHGTTLTTSNAETNGANVTIEVGSAKDLKDFQVGDLVTIIDSDGSDEEDVTIESIDTSGPSFIGDLSNSHTAGASVYLKWITPESGTSDFVNGETDEERHVAAVSIPLCGQVRLALTENGGSADTKMAIRWLEQ